MKLFSNMLSVGSCESGKLVTLRITNKGSFIIPDMFELSFSAAITELAGGILGSLTESQERNLIERSL